MITKEIKAIGTLVIVLALISTFYMDDYRAVLEEYPDRQLILLTGWDDKVELIGRSHDSSVPFYKWKYQDGKTKAYLGSDLVDTVSWQVYVGSKQVKGAYTDLIDYEYNDNVAKVIMKRYVYYDSRRTNFAGLLNMELEIYPNTNKETVTWVPANDSIRYNILSTHETDDYGQRGKLNETRVDLEKLQIDWNDSKEQVSSAYRYLNGKVKIRYKSAYGTQIIDPTITLGPLIIEYWQEDFGDKKYEPTCINCNLPLAIQFNKNKVITDPTELTGKFTKKNEESKGLKDWGIELGSNESYEVPVWISDWICENKTIINSSGTFEIENCTDFGGLEQIIKYEVVWTNVSFPISVQKNVKYNINLWGNLHIEEGNAVDAMFSIFGIDTWEYAWWNASYPAKYPMYVSSNYQATIPYPINLSTIYLNGTTAQVMWANAPNESYLYENGESVYAVVNNAEDTQLNMTNETSIAQASYGNLWDGMTGLVERYDMVCDMVSSPTTGTDGTVTGTTCVAGKFGNALHFDGDGSDYVTFSGYNLPENEGTISYWVKRNDDDDAQSFMQEGGFSGHFWHHPSYATSMLFSVYDGGWKDLTISDIHFPADTWVYVSISWKDNANISAYINGTFINSLSVGNVYHNGVYDWTIGSLFDASGWYFNGTLDELRVENRWVSDAERVAEYNSATISTLGTRTLDNTAPTVTANVTKPDTVYTNTDWTVNMTIIDPEADTLSAYVQFYVNDTLTGSIINYTITNNTNTLVATLAQGNYSREDNLTAETWAGDGTVNTSKVNLTFTGVHLGCGTLSTSGVYTLASNISSTETCFTITASDIYLDGAGYMINYSTSGQGLAITNAVGDNLTIKDLIIHLDAAIGNIAIYLSSVSNITIDNVNITTTGNSGTGIRFNGLDAGSVSTVENVYITSNAQEAFSASNPEGLNVTSCSFSAPNDEEYNIASLGSEVYFIANKWTSTKGIYFNDQTSWFKYNNETDGNIWLQTRVSSDTLLDRDLLNWNSSYMQWNDSSSVAMTSTYNITGLTASTNHNVTNSTTSRTITTDASGKITFDVYLTQDVETTITVDVITVGDSCDCPASGNMAIDCSDNCDIESCDLQTNNFTATGDGTVTGFKNLYNYTWGMVRCTNWEIE